MLPEALIFNADGTLSETDEIHRTAYNLSFRDHDLSWQWSHSVYVRMIDTLTAKEKITDFVTRYRADELYKIEDTSFITSLVRRKNAHFLNLIESGAAVLRPGVSRLINEAKAAGLKLAIVSHGRRSDFEIILQNQFGLGALAYFDAITTIEDIERAHGAHSDLERIYRRTLEKLDVTPSGTFAIESRQTSAAAAKMLGINVIATPGLYTSSARFPAADLVLSDLGHPAAPFHVIRGRAGAHHFVSVDALQAWSSGLSEVSPFNFRQTAHEHSFRARPQSAQVSRRASSL